MPMANKNLVDLHVYLVPTEVWNEKYHSAYNDVISQTISAGFVRVWPELSLYYLRNQIIDQLGYDVLPPEYVFLKSVGRCLTQVKTKQEFELKVKNFIPPQVTLPELFVLEAKRDDLSLASFESQSEQDSHRSNHDRMDIIGATRPSNVGVQHAPDTSRTAQQTNHLQDISMETPSPNQSPRSILKHHPNQSSHSFQSANMNPSPSSSLVNSAIDSPYNTPQSSSRLPRLVTQASQTHPTAHFNPKTPSRNPSSHLQTGSQMGLGSPQKSPLSPRHQPLTPLPARLTQLSDPDSSPNSSNNSAGSGGRASTLILPPSLVTNQHSNPQHRHVSSSVISNSFSPFTDTHSSPANVHFNQTESPGSDNWAITQPSRASQHQSSQTCETPFQTPNITPGGVPPLPLQHLEPRKGVDPASPLKSWRPDTYTNNTNEDSGIAELEYGRQGSNSLDGNDKDGKPQGRGTFLINSREGPEGGRAQQSRHDKKRHQHLEDGTPLPSNTAAQDQERQRQAEAREKQQQDREKKIKEDAAREQEHKERQLEKENQRLMEKRKKEKEDEEERQRLFKARQHEIEKRRQQQAEAKRLKEEDEEREMEEEIRKRQADELKQSRQKSHQDAKRKEREQFTPHSQRDGGSHQQKEQYDAYAKDFIKKEEQFGGNTRQSNRTRDEGVSLADETGGSPGNDGSLGSAGASSDGGQGPSGVSRAIFDSEGERILAQVQEMQDRRYLLESEREELMRFAKTLQSRMIDRRNKDEDGGESGGGTMRPVRDLWKKRYFEEKKKTNPLEEQVNRLRGQLDQQHRKLLSHLEGRGAYQKGAPRINAPPSKKNDHKILIIKTKHSIEDLRRRVENSKMKLTSEIKLRNQAETELRNLRSEVIQRKINVTISTSKSKLQNTIGRDEAQPSRNMATRATGVSITPHGSQKRGVKF
ncbi:inner centromere protein-like isoform X2 [Asterias rubens]|uniref:inner centromere protein-like isoform X2 n=1 Tax=Asterias rubens TaxID=7604 RepID=UPI00145507A0|nr:inner centromere protein-like isoform X2 [Asterias rubens]